MADEKQETSSPPEAESAEGAADAEAGATDVQRELDEARAKADQYYQSWQRAAADFANYKRRQDEDKRFAERWLLQDLLPVLDDFERAWASAPNELLKFTWLEGLLQINSKLFAVLQRHGVTPIEAENREFNPVEHEAVMREEDSDPSEQTAVVVQLQRGYRLHERVLRPALVKVGKPKADSGEAEAGAEAAEPSA